MKLAKTYHINIGPWSEAIYFFILLNVVLVASCTSVFIGYPAHNAELANQVLE